MGQILLNRFGAVFLVLAACVLILLGFAETVAVQVPAPENRRVAFWLSDGDRWSCIKRG